MGHLDELVVNGEPPEWSGQVCDQLLVCQHWYKGELSAMANTIHFCVEGDWVCLFIDCGIIYWRYDRGEPEEFDAPEIFAEYRLLDVGKKGKLSGLRLCGIVQAPTEKGSRVEFEFEGDRLFIVEDESDLTRYAF